MEIIDVTHLDSRKIKELYLDEKEELINQDNWNHIFREKWYLVDKRKYIIKIHLFDSYGHWIRMTPSMSFDMQFDSTYIKQIEKAYGNKPIYYVETLKTSKPDTQVKGWLLRVAATEVYKFPYEKLIS